MKDSEHRKAAKIFAEKWKGIGYEKGDSARFWMTLLNEVYGVKQVGDFIKFEERVKMDNTSFIDGFIPSTHVLIEQKSINKDLRKAIRQSDGTLLSPFQQAKRYSIELPYDDRPRWIVLSNFKEFHIYDMNKPNSEPEVLLLQNLEEEYYRLFFLIDKNDHNIKKETEVSLQAGQLVGILYDALLKQYKNKNDEDTLRNLNILCVRLVFCLYAEDAGLFGKHNMFHDYLDKYKDLDFRSALINLFKVLNQKNEDRDPYMDDDLAAFPYVNGGLFEDDSIIIPRINAEIIDIILNKASLNFDWSKISPTIFGGVFESTLNPETRRSGGMHYTSLTNIHKVIDPLFMSSLTEELEAIKSIKTINLQKKKLVEFHDKLASLTFLDPAAGSGNFLTETYLSLRKLENEVLKLMYGNQIIMGIAHNPIKVSISQFYGIEINDFAVSVARTALWIAESQMMKETEDIITMDLEFLPLKSYSNIIEGNALNLEWEDITSDKKINYIIGNPPFIGGMMMSSEQTDDLKNVFGKVKGVGEFDYVTGWFMKAAKLMKRYNEIRTAFVSTNSISQGQSVITFWKELIENQDIKISFAFRTFKWESEASDKAAVHCVIVGIINHNQTPINILYNSAGIPKKVNNINPYLYEGDSNFIDIRTNPISNVSKMCFGSMPRDGGFFILSDDEKEEIIKNYPDVQEWIRPYIGAREFINRTNRWVLWLVDVNPLEVIKIPAIVERIEKVKNFRLASKAEATKKLAITPTLFAQIAQPSEGDYILVPSVTSERRKYIPIGFENYKTIASNAVFIIPHSNIYEFSILTSNVHMAWVRIVGGRMKSDYRYSKDIVYNNFPWPSPSKKQKQRIEITGNKILEIREKYKEWSYANLYDETFMPADLRKAHQENDKMVMEAYGFDWRNMTESDCVTELFNLYNNLKQKI